MWCWQLLVKIFHTDTDGARDLLDQRSIAVERLDDRDRHKKPKNGNHRDRDEKVNLLIERSLHVISIAHQPIKRLRPLLK